MNAGALVYCILDAEGEYTPDGYELIDSATAGDYELKLWKGHQHVKETPVKFYEVSLNAKGRSFDPASQATKYTGSVHALGQRRDVIGIVAKWIKQYKEFYIGSYEPDKVRLYNRLMRHYLPKFHISEPYAAFDECEGKPEYFKVSAPDGLVESILEGQEDDIDPSSYISDLPDRKQDLKALVDARTCTKAQAVEYAVICAEDVLFIWEEAHPEDDRPRKAIEATRAWLAEPTEARRVDANSAADAYSAATDAYAADAAYYADAAAYYAANAAYYAARAADSAAYAAAAYAAYAADAANSALKEYRNKIVSESEYDPDTVDPSKYVSELPSAMDQAITWAKQEITRRIEYERGAYGDASEGIDPDNLFDEMAEIVTAALERHHLTEENEIKGGQLFNTVHHHLMKYVDNRWPDDLP